MSAFDQSCYFCKRGVIPQQNKLDSQLRKFFVQQTNASYLIYHLRLLYIYIYIAYCFLLDWLLPALAAHRSSHNGSAQDLGPRAKELSPPSTGPYPLWLNTCASREIIRQPSVINRHSMTGNVYIYIYIYIPGTYMYDIY